MSYILVIVESPGKIKKIKHILETITQDKYEVIASMGHIIDLPSDKLSIDVENNFASKYQILKDKHDVVNKMKKYASQASKILIATDEDREGEMIAWSIEYVLNLQNSNNYARIIFNSITEPELKKAITNPIKIDYNMVNAQKTRRQLDRIVGYGLSPLLWKKIGASLSAGRVQSVVAKLIIEREKEITDFFIQPNIDYSYYITGNFLDAASNIFSAKLNQQLKNNQELDNFMNSIKLSKFILSSITDKDSKKSPCPPYTTSTLQQDASRKLSLTIKKTMLLAQHLYEAGYITYMRTDSISIAPEILKEIQTYIISKYGQAYSKLTDYKPKNANIQGAHEAIRPTNIHIQDLDLKNKIGTDEQRLYTLIWKRTITSQMEQAKLLIRTIQININNMPNYHFISSIESIIFDGFLIIYNAIKQTPDKKTKKKIILDNHQPNQQQNNQQNQDIKLPKLNELIENHNIIADQIYDKPISRYNEASLVNKLDPSNLNIGRPSTYATIISKIQERNYVKTDDIAGIEKEVSRFVLQDNILTKTIDKICIGKDTNKLIPTSLGIQVNTFLNTYFPELMDYQFTAKLEEDLDKIADGIIQWTDIISKFYNDLHTIISQVQILELANSKESKYIGEHPITKYKIYGEVSRYGEILKMIPDKGKIITGPIKAPLSLDTITLQDAVQIFEYPKNLGKYNRKMVVLKRGQYGLYISYGKEANISLSKLNIPEDQINNIVNLEYVIELIKEKNKNILFSQKDGKTIYSILTGPYGNYIKIETPPKKPHNIKFPNAISLDGITLDKIKEIIAQPVKRVYKKKIKD